MEEILVASMSRHLNAREAVRNTKNVFTKEKLCLNNLVALYDGLTTPVDVGRAMSVVYLDFCKAFEVFPNNILISNWGRYGFDGWNIKWIRNWTDGNFQRIAVNSTLSIRRLGSTGTTINQYIYYQTLGLSGYSAGLQMIPSWAVQLIHLKEGSRGIFSAWRSRPIWTLWSSISPRSCIYLSIKT